MLMSKRHRWVAILLIATGLLCACQSASGRPDTASSTSARPASTVVDRPLRIAITNEAPAVAGKFASGASGTAEYADIFAAKLARMDYLGQPTAQLAEDVPSSSMAPGG